MLIAIDANEANVKNRVGIGQYAYHILKNIHRLDQNNQYIIYLKHPPLSDLPKSRSNWQYKVFGPTKLWTKFALPFHLYTTNPKPNIFLSLSHYSPQFCPCPTILAIMDLGYLKYNKQFTKKDLYQLKNWTAQSIKKSSHIITISQFTKDEIIKTYHINPSQITIAPPGVTLQKPTKTQINQTLNHFNITKPYFLYLGTLKPSKNIPFLIKSFATFLKKQSTKIPKYKLVIAGKKGWLYDQIFATVKKLNMRNHVIFTDFINESQKWALYKQATALIIPSFYEGFGMPALEAMSVGTPTIASNIASLPQVVGDSGILINPYKQTQLVKSLVQLTNPQTRKKLSQKSLTQSKQFSWATSAKTIIRLFKTF